MAIINKPDMTNLWASGGAVIAPSASKVQTGWTAEIPPHQWENWVQHRQDEAIAYLFQRGIPEWDATTEYSANGSYVQWNGKTYKAIANSINVPPSNTSSWKEWGLELDDLPLASTTQLGAIQIATTSEAQALNDDTKALTPKKLLDSGAVFSGEVRVFAGAEANIPDGWLHCNGATISRTTYSRLFTVIGTTYGGGNGSTTFNLPDLRGEFVRGADAGRGVDSGRALGSAQLDQMQRITGSMSNNRSSTNATGSGALSRTNPASVSYTGPGAGEEHTITFDSGNSPDARVSATTGGETRPRNVAMNYIIKY